MILCSSPKFYPLHTRVVKWKIHTQHPGKHEVQLHKLPAPELLEHHREMGKKIETKRQHGILDIKTSFNY